MWLVGDAVSLIGVVRRPPFANAANACATSKGLTSAAPSTTDGYGGSGEVISKRRAASMIGGCRKLSAVNFVVAPATFNWYWLVFARRALRITTA